jgi:HEAT repeat protein
MLAETLLSIALAIPNTPPPRQAPQPTVAELIAQLPSCLELDCPPIVALVAMGESVWPDLDAGLDAKDEMVRFWSLGVLSEVPVAAARGKLIALLADGAVRIRAASAFALGAQRSPEVVPALLGAIFDPDVNVRLEVATALARVPDPRAVEPLIELLGDPDHDVRAAACDALGAIGDGRAAGPLVMRIREDRKPLVRGHAAAALGALGPATLGAGLKDSVEALAKRASRERDLEALGAMIWALGELGQADDGLSVSTLEALGGHADEGVRGRAKASLEAIRARPLPAK